MKIAGYVLAACAAVVVFGIAVWKFRKQQNQRRRDEAMQNFGALKSQLQAEFSRKAAQSGKPRGLRWKECELHDRHVFAQDRVTGELYALVGATISFEAIEGGPMEDVEAVGNLRAGSAVFVFREGKWTTDGRTVFNLLPSDAIEHYEQSLTPIK